MIHDRTDSSTPLDIDFHLFFDRATDGILMIDAEGMRIRLANAKIQQMVGYSEDELLSLRAQDLHPPEDWGYVIERLQKRLRGVSNSNTEVPVLRKDGTVFYAEVSGSLVQSHGKQCVIGFFRDITDQKRLREDLERKESLFRRENALLKAMMESPIGVIMFALDRSYCYTAFTNSHKQTMRKIWGVEIAVGMSMLELISDPADREKAKRNFDRALQGEHFVLEEMYGDVAHCRAYYENRYSSIPGPDGEVIGVTVFVIDITERKRLEAQLGQAQKLEAVGQLAGGVAHDFNNMLGVILGHAEMALEQLDASMPLYDDLKQIRKAAQRSADLTRQLLTFARKQIIAPEVMNLNESVAGALKMLERLVGEHIRFVWNPAAELWLTFMDPTQLEHSLANLCINARDAIDTVGSITIETRNVVFDRDYCTRHPHCSPGEFVQLSVVDTGCGMSPETQAHIFEPFFTTKGTGKGTGLGLAMVYGAVRQNQGFILVESAPGRGTTLSICLPRYVGPAEQGGKQDAPIPVRHIGKTILLVEDEEGLLALIKGMLERQGHIVFSASTPGQALMTAKEWGGAIDLVITDVVMPEMDGVELVRQLQRLRPNLKSLYMSGHTASVMASHGVLDDGYDLIQKPFSKNQLFAKMEDVLDRDRGVARSPAC